VQLTLDSEEGERMMTLLLTREAAMWRKTCPVCNVDLNPGVVEEAAGQEKSLEVKLHRLPVLECPNGHRQFADPKFPQLLLDRLVERDEARLPASNAKGMVFKEYHCAACGDKLTDPGDRPHTFHVDVELAELAPFDVELTVPVHRCARCGHEQLHSLSEIRRHTPGALAHAFKGAAIAPPR
jgi:hypothetical protein